MTIPEIKRELVRLLNLTLAVTNAQSSNCSHHHHCHRISELYEIEDIARDLTREMEILEGEAVLQRQG